MAQGFYHYLSGVVEIEINTGRVDSLICNRRRLSEPPIGNWLGQVLEYLVR
jgi:hypothetical protein